RLDELAARTRALGMHAVALTDRDSLAGAVRFTQACNAYGIRPIYGVRLTTCAESGGERFVVTLLARDARGYENLCRLISAAHHSGERGDPCSTVADAATHSDGAIVFAGSRSDLGGLIDKKQPEAARVALRRWLEIFGFRRTVVE